MVHEFNPTFLYSIKGVNSHGGPGGRGRETQKRRRFWARLLPLRLKSVNSHRDCRGGVLKRGIEVLRRCRESRRSEDFEKRSRKEVFEGGRETSPEKMS